MEAVMSTVSTHIGQIRNEAYAKKGEIEKLNGKSHEVAKRMTDMKNEMDNARDELMKKKGMNFEEALTSPKSPGSKIRKK